MWYNRFIEQNKLPDFILRIGMRILLKHRLNEETVEDAEVQQHRLNDFLEELKNSPIALANEDARRQHYKLPPEFYQYCFGKRLKSSAGYWRPGVTDLDTAEEDMLELTCQRADLQNGQDILELGCGWGSMSLFISAKYPESRITVVSDSAIQKAFIDQTAKDRNISNLTVITADMNTFQILQQFDRVVSIGMFEYMRNYKMLLKKVNGFLKDNGKLFVHMFSHHTLAYKLEVKDGTDWMNNYFFGAGMVPSNHLLSYFNDDLAIDRHWVVNGMNYSRTAEAWLSNMDSHEKEIMTMFEKIYGEDQALKWWVYWRLSFIACAEMFGYRSGNEWMVCHYLFKKNS